MDQITYSYSSSTTSSSNNPPPKITKSTRPSYTNSLHSIRKPITKPFIAPLPPTPHKVYNVNPSDFKQAVRMLTSSPEFQSPSSRRLKDIAPPPLILSTIPKPSICPKPQPPPPQPPSSAGGVSPDSSNFFNEAMDTNKFISKTPVMDYFESLSPLCLNLSPSSFSWCSSVLLTPISCRFPEHSTATGRLE